jgi:hypothetical protein
MQTLDALAGKRVSKIETNLLSSGFWEGITKLQSVNKFLKPYSFGTAPRPISKMHDWRASEVRSFITQDFLVYADALQESPNQESQRQYRLTARLLECPHTINSGELHDLDHLDPADRGILSVTVRTLGHHLGVFLNLREMVFYRREAKYLKSICVSTSVECAPPMHGPAIDHCSERCSPVTWIVCRPIY